MFLILRFYLPINNIGGVKGSFFPYKADALQIGPLPRGLYVAVVKPP
jgi:hypothetical protein